MSWPSFLSAHIFDFGKNEFILFCWLYLCIHLSAEWTKIGSLLEMTLKRQKLFIVSSGSSWLKMNIEQIHTFLLYILEIQHNICLYLQNCMVAEEDMMYPRHLQIRCLCSELAEPVKWKCFKFDTLDSMDRVY